MFFEIREAQHLAVSRVVQTKPRTVQFYEVDLFLDGGREITVDGSTYRTEANSAMCRKPGQVVYSCGSYNDLILSFRLKKTGDTAAECLFLPQLLQMLPTFFRPEHFSELKKIALELIEAHNCGYAPSVISAHFHRYLLTLGVDHLADTVAHYAVPSTRMNAVTTFIAAHFAEPLNVDRLAALVHLDKYYFIRCFKAEVGVSPKKYLIQKRIEEAKLLLSRFDLPVGEVAEMVGYSDAGYFISAFRRETGESPNRYRKRMWTERSTG